MRSKVLVQSLSVRLALSTPCSHDVGVVAVVKNQMSPRLWDLRNDSSWIWRTIERIYTFVHPGGYGDEHINPYTRAGLRGELEDNGFAVENLETICRVEMIFKATKKGSRL